MHTLRQLLSSRHSLNCRMELLKGREGEESLLLVMGCNSLEVIIVATRSLLWASTLQQMG